MLDEHVRTSNSCPFMAYLQQLGLQTVTMPGICEELQIFINKRLQRIVNTKDC